MSPNIQNKEEKSLLQQALLYAEKGLSVIPVGQDKKPLIAWKEFTERRATSEEIKGWWNTFGNPQIGIVTGRISGITVVDIENGGDTKGMPITLIAQTGGGGWHYYFKYTPDIGNKARIRPLTDIRNDNGYVIAPNSSNLKGRYEWLVEEPLNDFPHHLFGVEKKQDWDQITQGAEQGSRNESAAKLIGKLLKTFRREEWNTSAWSMVIAWNQNNKPPLEERELRTTFESICRKAAQAGDGLKEESKAETLPPLQIEYVSFTNLIGRATDELLSIDPAQVISFGYDWLDKRLTGIFPGELVIVGGESGTGKCLNPEYEIIMANGTFKKMYELQVGDEVMGIDEKPRRITEIHKGISRLWHVRTKKNQEFYCNMHHICPIVFSNDTIHNIEYDTKHDTPLVCLRDEKPRLIEFKEKNKFKKQFCKINQSYRGKYIGFQLYGKDAFFIGKDRIVHHNSTFCNNIIYKTSSLGHKCLIFGLEDRLNDYGIKALYYEVNKHKRLYEGITTSNYDWNLYRTNQLHTDPVFMNYMGMAYDSLKKDNVYFVKVDEIMTIELLEKIVEEKTKEGFQLFLIDHLHYFDLQKGQNSKADYIEEVMIKIRTMQRRTGARIIMVVHYRKLNGLKPSLDSFKDSISIVQNANYVINLWRDRSMEAEGNSRFKTYFYIPKARNPLGEANLEVIFNPNTNDYEMENKWGYGT